MENRYLVSVDDLKSNGLIHGNVDSELITPILLRVQDRTIQMMLGTALYKKLLDYVQTYNNGSGTAIPEPYANLLYKYVIPAIIPHVEMRSTTFVTWRVRNAGAGTFNDQYFKTSTRQEVDDLKKMIEGDSNYYDNELIKHLTWSVTNGTEGGKLYTEYDCGQCIDGGHDPQSKKKTIGNFAFVKGGKSKKHCGRFNDHNRC
jgi:hypothetical protein